MKILLRSCREAIIPIVVQGADEEDCHCKRAEMLSLAGCCSKQQTFVGGEAVHPRNVSQVIEILCGRRQMTNGWTP